MAPLLPSESKVYSLSLPDESPDPRLNLSARVGAALTYTYSAVVIHGGLAMELALPKVSIETVEQALRERCGDTPWSDFLSNEIFYLNIITRSWHRFLLRDNTVKPCPRLFHSLTFTGDSIFLFGGLCLDSHNADKLVPTNDLWELTIDTGAWVCLDDGSHSGIVSRFDHSILAVSYKSPADHKQHPAIAIIGGRGELNQELMHISIFDLESKQYVNNTEMQLSLNELKTRNDSVGSSVDPHVSAGTQRAKLKMSKDNSFVISGSSKETGEGLKDEFFVLSQDISVIEHGKNPIVSLPISPNASGMRLPLSQSFHSNKSVVPRGLCRPTGDVFGPNIIVSGTNSATQEFEVFSFNRPSHKWCRLNVDNNKRRTNMYLWRSFSWHSHHKVLILGSATRPKDSSEGYTIQKFDTMVLVNQPMINSFCGVADNEGKEQPTSNFGNLKKSTTFEAYSKYIAPTSKIRTMGSVFPTYAVTLGRSAFERFGSSLTDFELVTADGDRVNVPLVLLRKRWGRCFDMLLAKAYSRAVQTLENGKEPTDEEDDTTSVMSGSNKRSVLMLNKASYTRDRADSPQFRLPFQEKTPPTPLTPLSTSGDTQSRKQSVVSIGAESILSTSTSELPDSVNFENIPPVQPEPTEPVPPLDMRVPMKQMNSRDYLRDPMRGSISGASLASGGTNTSAVRPKELKTPVSLLKRRATSRSSSVPNTDDETFSNTGSELLSDDTLKGFLEPLLIPRALYLPFHTVTVRALTEFLFTGQLGDKWLLTPTTTDMLLIAKFYELPLLYDLISEVIYTVISKKESALMQAYADMINDFKKKLHEVCHNNDDLINTFCTTHAHIKSSFDQIEGYLATVDDGYFNLELLRKASTVTSTPSSPRSSCDASPRRLSSRRTRLGKSSLSREIRHMDYDTEESDDQNSVVEPVSVNRSPIKFRTDSMSRSSLKKVEVEDSIDPLSKTVSSVIDDDSLSPKDNADVTQNSKIVLTVPEGEFSMDKQKVKESSSSPNDTDNKTTSDSDDLGVGLGLVSNVTVKKKSSTDKTNDKNNQEEDDEEEDEEHLATWEKIAAPDSPPPDDSLMKIIYETAALACDMKMLLRCSNALDMSKALEQKKVECLKELEEFGNRLLASDLERDMTLTPANIENEGLKPRSVKSVKSEESTSVDLDHELQSATMRRGESIETTATAGTTATAASSAFDTESIISRRTLRSKLPRIGSLVSLSSTAGRKPSTAGTDDRRAPGSSTSRDKKKFLGFMRRA